MENKVNQRVIEFLKFKNIRKMTICFHAVLSPEKLHVEKSII